jgi:hypothetical protein
VKKFFEKSIFRVVSKGEYKNCQKKGLKVLFSLRKLFSNFEQLPANLSCKLFDTLIRPILSYNCEIWYMDEYLPLYRAMLRATRNNTFCDTLALQEKSSYEKIDTKYCKTVLGLKKCMQHFDIIRVGATPYCFLY